MENPVRMQALAVAPFLFSALLVSACSDEPLTWDTPVELRGSVMQEAHYGPPNYGETPLDDRAEVAYVLHLDRPITVSGASDFIDGPAVSQEEIQLVLHTEAMFRDIPSSACVRVVGKLFAAHTGHHHRLILMSVDSYTLCNQTARTPNDLQEISKRRNIAPRYDPSIEGLPWETSITLKGVVQLESFNGPPGYGETPLADLIETIRVLSLNSPVTVNGPSQYGYSAAVDQDKIHLESMDTDLRTQIPLDTCLLLTGSLYGSRAGHFYYPVQMIIESYSACR